MGAAASPDLCQLAEDVRNAVRKLHIHLVENPFQGEVLLPLRSDSRKLHSALRGILYSGFMKRNAPENEKIVQDMVTALEELEGWLNLLITTSDRLKESRTQASRDELEETWMKRRNTLLRQLHPCDENLTAFLVLARTLLLDEEPPTSRAPQQAALESEQASKPQSDTA